MQLNIVIEVTILNFPLCYILIIIYFNLGLLAVPLAGIFCMAFEAVLAPILAYELLNKIAPGPLNR